jgi:hypothetical protein
MGDVKMVDGSNPGSGIIADGGTTMEPQSEQELVALSGRAMTTTGAGTGGCAAAY